MKSTAFKSLIKVNFDFNNIATKPLMITMLKSLSIDGNPISLQIIKKALDTVLHMKTCNPYYAASDDNSVDYVTAFIELLNTAANISPDMSLPAQNNYYETEGVEHCML